MSAANGKRGTSRPARRLMMVALPIAAIVGLAGCSAGQLAETSQIRSAVDGVAADIGSIAVRDASFAPPSGNSYAEGDSLPMNFTVINSALESDQITAATVDGQTAEVRGALSADASSSAGPTSTTAPSTSSAPSSSASGSESSSAADSSASGSASATPAGPLPPTTIMLPAQTLVSVGDNATIVLMTTAKQYYPSQLIPVTITFKNAGVLSLKVPVGVPMAEQPTNSSSDFNFHPGGE